MAVQPYEKFDAWKLTHELALEVYRITERWPKTERYQLTAQTRNLWGNFPFPGFPGAPGETKKEDGEEPKA